MIKKIINQLKKILRPKYFETLEIKYREKILENKVALITGGSGDIGYSIAKSFIDSGCKVIITGRNEEKLKECKKNLGTNCEYLLLDLNDYNDISKKILVAVKCFGKIDILVNCAGIHNSRYDLDFLNVSEKEFDDVIDTNLKGTYFVTQQMAKYFVKNHVHAHILFITSNRGSEPAWSPYSISKWGLNGLIQGAAKKLIKYEIVVNGIAPGPVASKMNNVSNGDSIYTNQVMNNRFVLTREIANYATILVSDASNMIVGDIIYISGGRGKIDNR